MKAALIVLALLATPATAGTITPISITIDPNAGTIAGLNWSYNGTFASPIMWASNAPVWPGFYPSVNWLRLDLQFTTPLELLSSNAVGVFAIVNLVMAGPFPWFSGSPSGPALADGLLAINNFAGVLPDVYSQYNQGVRDQGFLAPLPVEFSGVDLVSASFAYLFGNPPIEIIGYQILVGTVLPPPPPGVPEPSTWGLLLFGFAFFALKGIWPSRASHE